MVESRASLRIESSKYNARQGLLSLLKVAWRVGKCSIFSSRGVSANKKLNRDILKWAFAAQILRPFQTTAHAGMLRYAP